MKLLDVLTEGAVETEGLFPGQTPIRDTNLSKGGRSKSRFKDTVQGFKIDWDAWEKAPSNRKNFYYVKPEDVSGVIRKQFKNYITSPEKYGLSEESTLEDVIKLFDQERPQNKIKKLIDAGIDVGTKIKNLSEKFDLSWFNIFGTDAYAQEVLPDQEEFTLDEVLALQPQEEKEKNIYTLDEIVNLPPKDMQLPKQGAQLKALPADYKMRKATPEEEQQDFDFAVNRLAEQIFTASTGLTPKEGELGKKKFDKAMNLAISSSLMGPVYAMAFELYGQAKSITVASLKKEKYSPLETRVLTELLPDDLPKWAKNAVYGTEVISDIAIMSGLATVAKEQTLKDVIKTIGKKLQKAGYGEGKLSVSKEAIKEAAKGTSLEKSASAWIQSKLWQPIKKAAEVPKIGTAPIPEPVVPQIGQAVSSIPKFKNTQEAVAFGKTAKPEQLKEMQTRRAPEQSVPAKIEPAPLKQDLVTKLQSIRETLKRPEAITKAEIKAIQQDIVNTLKDSDLDLKDKGKFLSTIKNIQTQSQLKKAMPEIEARITTLEQKAEKRELVKQIKKFAEKSESASIDAEYRESIQEMIEGFDLKGRSEDTIRRLESTKAYIDRQLAAGKDVEMPADVINQLSLLSKKRLSDISNDELKNLISSIETLEQIGKTKQKLKELSYNKKKNIIKSSLVNDVKAINTRQIPEVPIGTTRNKSAERYIKLLNHLSKTKVGLTPIEGLADITGMRKMKDVLDKNFSSYLTFNDKMFNDWYELTKNFEQGNFDRIGAYAIAQQEGGLVKLNESGISKEQIDAIVFTPEEQAAYDFVRQTFDSYYPEIKKYSVDVYNKDVGKINNYVSFMADTDGMNDLESYDKFSGKTEEAVAARMTKTVEKGFLESRTEGAKYAIEKNIDKIFRRHMDDVAYMLTMGKDIKMYYEIVNSPEMRESLGDLGSLAWLQYLDLMARKGGSDSSKRIAAIDLLRRNIGAGVLGFRLSSALVQFSSFGDTMATIGAEWATRGASDIATSSEWRNFIMDNFPEVRKAIGDDIAFREFGEDMFGKVQRAGMAPLQFMDGIMRSTAAAGSYEKICFDKGIPIDLKNPNQDIIQEATKLMRQSQGSSFFKDQPLSITTDFGLMDNKSVNKFILTFQSFMLNRWDNINRQIWRLGIKEKDYKKAISSLLWLLIFSAAGEEVLRMGTRKVMSIGRNKKDVREEDPFAQDVAFNVLQSIPIAGQLASSITFSSNPIPVINVSEDVLKGLSSVVKGKKASTKIKGGIKVLGGIATLAGVPGASQASQIIRERIPETKTKKRQLRD